MLKNNDHTCQPDPEPYGDSKRCFICGKKLSKSGR